MGALLRMDEPVRTGVGSPIHDYRLPHWPAFVDAHGQLDAPVRLLGGVTRAFPPVVLMGRASERFVTQDNLSMGCR